MPAKAVRGSSLVGFWCEFCSGLHVHGDPDREKKFHRCSHCHVKGSPLAGGYIVRVTGAVDALRDLRPGRQARTKDELP